MYLVQDFYQNYKKALGLELIAGDRGLLGSIRFPEIQRPGLALSGIKPNITPWRLLVLGKEEILYLEELDKLTRITRLRDLLSEETPAVLIGRNYAACPELIELCQQDGICLFRSPLPTMMLLNKVIHALSEAFAPTITVHGTLVEVFGVGMLIQGESSVGKSEAALGLIERGHRLISDDLVCVRVHEGLYLEGYGPELTRHLIEIRGIGIVNVAHLYGAVCVRDKKGINLVVKLELWDERNFYDRVGLDQKITEILGVELAYHLLPVKPGRDIILLLETIALNHRLKEMGYNSAKEFNAKLIEAISKKQRGGYRETYTHATGEKSIGFARSPS